ncbi:MAG: hypothetical protein ACRENZ_06020, partial [Thermodesulfobacteriota bacterium]
MKRINYKEYNKIIYKLLILILVYSCASKGMESTPAEPQLSTSNINNNRYLQDNHQAYYHFTLSILNKNRGKLMKALDELEIAEGLDPNSS